MEKYSPIDKAILMERRKKSCQATFLATHIDVNKSRSCLLKLSLSVELERRLQDGAESKQQHSCYQSQIPPQTEASQEDE